jgi:hypothetical protein
MPMDMKQEFIDNYAADDFPKIKFDWNGKHADHFVDKNIDFRNQVCEQVLNQLDKAKLELIRDLYLEEANCAKEAWGVSKRFKLLGQELIKGGKSEYIMDYLTGASRSMDTNMMSADIQIDKAQAKELYDYLKERLKTEKDEFNKKLIEHIGLRRFEWLSK